jgi:hypothetical protein
LTTHQLLMHGGQTRCRKLSPCVHASTGTAVVCWAASAAVAADCCIPWHAGSDVVVSRLYTRRLWLPS